MKDFSMQIHSKVKDYTLNIVDDIWQLRELVYSKCKTDRRFYFIDAIVYKKYEQQLKHFIGEDPHAVISALETQKEYSALVPYYRTLIEGGFQRRDTLITIGGGILQDISGFIASTMYRGIPWLFIPTTLLAQADSCIGSKTSINVNDNKNLIGSFYPPDAIFIDVAFCKTLTDEYFNSGLGEIIKYHFMADKEKFDFLRAYLAAPDMRAPARLKSILWSSLEIKKSYFEGDEFDTGRRNLLNYGHCFGHALESAMEFAVCHGEAVIVGMGFSNLLSLRRGIMSNKLYDAFEMILRRQYPRIDLRVLSVEKILKFLRKDKKRSGLDLTMILAEDVGNLRKYDDVTEEEINNVFLDFFGRYSSTEYNNTV